MKVLVHCMYGQSRSCATIAAYLIAAHGSTYQDTLALLTQQHPDIHINPGFHRQLRALAALTVDLACRPIVHAVRCYSALPLFQRTTLAETSPCLFTATEPSHNSGSWYSCMSCRQPLVPTVYTVVKDDAGICVVPCRWMSTILSWHSPAGKLTCPKCHGKLGSYQWHCSAGRDDDNDDGAAGDGLGPHPLFRLTPSRVRSIASRDPDDRGKLFVYESLGALLSIDIDQVQQVLTLVKR